MPGLPDLGGGSTGSALFQAEPLMSGPGSFLVESASLLLEPQRLH